MRTRPTLQQAKFDGTVGDARANVIAVNRHIRTLEELARNTLQTTSDGAAITRMTNALETLRKMRANMSGIDAALSEATELYEAQQETKP